MNNAEPELRPVDYDNMIFDVWIYVNPLTGKHAKTTSTGKLAVFLNEEIGRSWETISTALSGMVGVIYNNPLWVAGGLGFCGVSLLLTSLVDKYLNRK